MKYFSATLIAFAVFAASSPASASVCDMNGAVHHGFGSAIYLGLAATTFFAPEGQIALSGGAAFINEDPEDPVDRSVVGSAVTGFADGEWDRLGLALIHSSRSDDLDLGSCVSSARTHTGIHASVRFDLAEGFALRAGVGPVVGIESDPNELILGASLFGRAEAALPFIDLHLEARGIYGIVVGTALAELAATARAFIDIPFAVRPYFQYEFILGPELGQASIGRGNSQLFTVGAALEF